MGTHQRVRAKGTQLRKYNYGYTSKGKGSEM